MLEKMETRNIEGTSLRTISAARRIISRDTLQDGSFLAMVRTIPGLEVRSDAEIEASLAEALSRGVSGPVWLFAYGSLMWNPAFLYEARRKATVFGWHRRFCLRVRIGRGSPDRPGLTLALDRGGSAHGVAFRLASGDEQSELLLVWRREMFGGAYHARWVSLSTEEGQINALTFVANRSNDIYVGKVERLKAAELIAQGAGPLGTSAEYLIECLAHLEELGIRDRGLESIWRLVRQRQADDTSHAATHY